MSTNTTFFKNRVQLLDQHLAELKSKSNNISALRIFLFVSFISLFIYILNIRVFIPLIAVTFVFITVFGLIVKWHNKVKHNLMLTKKMSQINQEEIHRLKYNFEELPMWDEFADERHQYSGDLDLYGKNGLFQLINRAETPAGINKMRLWLEHFANKETIESRQFAVKELAGKLDWRQKIQAYGKMRSSAKSNASELIQWLTGKDQISTNSFYRILPYPIMIIGLSLLIAILYQLIPLLFLFPLLLINGTLLMKIWDYSKKTYESTSSSIHLLQSIRQILHLIESEDLQYSYLSKLKSRLLDGIHPASKKISELQRIFDWLNLRGNQIYHIFNILFLLDFIIIMKAEKWRNKYKMEVNEWFEVIAELEAINSLAAFAYANNTYTFPVILDIEHHLSCKNLGHPLIHPKQRVSNDFEIKGRGEIGIVTGSNMSGKSTFLRTLGVNAVLAFAGAPVCASYMSLSLFQIFSSMRTKDNLEENISSFYAELLRLKMLLECINEKRAVFFLLDEILKGTNSTDRHIGAESLAVQLSEMNTFGLISTHDLKLGDLKLRDGKLKNYNFSSSIEEQEIIFDYKLREGICQSTNASQLMSKIGIKINSQTQNSSNVKSTSRNPNE